MKKNYTMVSFKSALFLIATAVLVCFMPNDLQAKVKSKKLVINTENGAKIFVDGKMIGATTTEIKVPAYSTVNVRVEKIGFITEERNFMNDDSHEIPKTYYIKLDPDDAYEQSFTTDIANKDIDIKTNQKEDDAWKLISRIITNSFDVIQVTDKATGYMCTAWTVKNFRAATVRTRLIIKTGSSEPLVYKAKLVSEIGKAGASANQDENFKPWDRVLRTYENVITDLQSRLGK
jgi:hypothetical protein